MKLWRMTDLELETYQEHCVKCGNTKALAEITAFKKWYGKYVEIISGRKYPKGTKGKVFYVEYKHYRPQEWFGWVVIVGFKDDFGNAYFTSETNLKNC